MWSGRLTIALNCAIVATAPQVIRHGGEKQIAQAIVPNLVNCMDQGTCGLNTLRESSVGTELSKALIVATHVCRSPGKGLKQRSGGSRRGAQHVGDHGHDGLVQLASVGQVVVRGVVGLSRRVRFRFFYDRSQESHRCKEVQITAVLRIVHRNGFVSLQDVFQVV